MPTKKNRDPHNANSDFNKAKSANILIKERIDELSNIPYSLNRDQLKAIRDKAAIEYLELHGLIVNDDNIKTISDNIYQYCQTQDALLNPKLSKTANTYRSIYKLVLKKTIDKEKLKIKRGTRKLNPITKFKKAGVLTA